MLAAGPVHERRIRSIFKGVHDSGDIAHFKKVHKQLDALVLQSYIYASNDLDEITSHLKCNMPRLMFKGVLLITAYDQPALGQLRLLRSKMRMVRCAIPSSFQVMLKKHDPSGVAIYITTVKKASQKVTILLMDRI